MYGKTSNAVKVTGAFEGRKKSQEEDQIMLIFILTDLDHNIFKHCQIL